MVLPFAASAPLCACVSIPRAMPLTIVIFRDASSYAMLRVTENP
jgi:hypothetical protein